MQPELIDALQLLAITALILFLVQALARATTAALVQRFGWSAVPWTTGWLGVPLHEFAHLVACWLTLRRVRAVQLFAPDKESGVMGSVTFEPGRGPVAWAAALVIGFAPLIGGTALLWLLANVAAPAPDLAGWVGKIALPFTGLVAPAEHTAAALEACLRATKAAWHQSTTTKFTAIALWYFACCVAVHLTPSRADLRGTWRGGLVLLGALAASVAGLQYFNIATQKPLALAITLGCQAALPALLLACLLLVAMRLLLIPLAMLPVPWPTK